MSNFNDLGISLKANNSSGGQTLYLSSQQEDGNAGFWFTLCGEYKGEKIQIDFNEMSREELKEHRHQIDIMLECAQ